MASLTQWTWIWANSRTWWRTGKPGCFSPCSCKELDMTEWLNNNNNLYLCAQVSCIQLTFFVWLLLIQLKFNTSKLISSLKLVFPSYTLPQMITIFLILVSFLSYILKFLWKYFLNSYIIFYLMEVGKSPSWFLNCWTFRQCPILCCFSKCTIVLIS